MDSWHAIGKHLLQKCDDKFGVFFPCKCSDIKDLDITSIPKYTSMDNCLGSCSTESKTDIFDKNMFGDSDIKFNRNPLFSNRC